MDGPPKLPDTWIALLGKRDTPTDGLADYSRFLAAGLATQGTEMKVVRVSWDEQGWFGALKNLWRESAAWRGKCVLVQYTALAWSGHGFPFGVFAAVRILRWRGARVAITFHEFQQQAGSRRWIDRVRGKCQLAVIRAIHSAAYTSVFTVPTESVPWLRQGDRKAHFIPIGGNIPERTDTRLPSHGKQKTVLVFGVTGGSNMSYELDAISTVMRQAANALGSLQLILCGRGSIEAGQGLVPTLSDCPVAIAVKGLMSAEDISSELAAADAFLFVRGAISLQRGSAMAGIATAVPMVGYKNGRVDHPLDEAGIEWAPVGDTTALAAALVRVLTDENRWKELHQRNLQVQREYFSWRQIAQQYLTDLPK
jgi:glycosyltransferase involved in cell wall biosynthesis